MSRALKAQLCYADNTSMDIYIEEPSAPPSKNSWQQQELDFSVLSSEMSARYQVVQAKHRLERLASVAELQQWFDLPCAARGQ